MSDTHMCSKCGEAKAKSKFQLYKGNPNGQCRDCKTEAMRVKRKLDGIPVRKASRIENGKKLCVSCDLLKPINMFSPSTRGLGGVAAYCRQCHADKYRNAGKSREATLKYREVNRERHLANHRVRMFEYRTRRSVTSDGTVTDAFLKALYEQELCHYCKHVTPRELRTADHKTPLARDGQHSANNLVMACCHCNSSKRDTPYELFIRK